MMINLVDDAVEVVVVVLVEKHVANHRDPLQVHEKPLSKKAIVQIQNR
jgi:hypothetical protein